jgi:hypothetical protein
MIFLLIMGGSMLARLWLLFLAMLTAAGASQPQLEKAEVLWQVEAGG